MTQKHPIQPPVVVNGIDRFKENPIINWMLNKGKKSEKFDMNDIAYEFVDTEHYQQFLQLIGYSLSGFPGNESIRNVAYAMLESGKSEQDAKIEYYEKKLEDIKSTLRPVYEAAFDGYEDLEESE